MEDSLGFKGQFTVEVRGKDGELKDQWNYNSFGNWLKAMGVDRQIPNITGKMQKSYSQHNLVVNAGLAGLASRINGNGAEAAFTYLAVGTGSTAAAATDTTLGTEITDSGLARASATVSRDTTNVTNDTAKLVKVFTVTGTKTVQEVGVFNAASSGTMLSRTVITSKNVENGDTLTLTWTVYATNA